MRFNLHGRKRVGPLFVNYSKRGLTSWGFKVGPFTWNAKTHQSTFDTPGPGSVSWGGRRRTRP